MGNCLKPALKRFHICDNPDVPGVLALVDDQRRIIRFACPLDYHTVGDSKFLKNYYIYEDELGAYIQTSDFGRCPYWFTKPTFI